MHMWYVKFMKKFFNLIRVSERLNSNLKKLIFFKHVQIQYYFIILVFLMHL